MDVLDPSPPGSAGPSEESRAIDLVSQAAGAEAPGAGAAQGVAAFADRLLARWVHQAGPLGEPPLAARLLDRLWSEEPRLGTLLDFPLFEPSALGFTSRWAAEPVVGYPSAWTLPRWQVLLPPEAGEEERPEREAVAGESWFTARARQEAAEQTARARRAAGRPTGKPEQPDQLELAPPHRGAAARLQRAQQLARLQAEPRRAPWPAPARPGLPAAQAGTAATGAPRRGPTPPVAATAGDALRPYPRAMGRAGALLPRLVAERFPLHYSNLHDLAVPLAPPLPGLPDAATARAAAGTGREGERGESAGPGPARRAHAARPGGPDELRRRREHPAAQLGDQAFSRTHLPALGAALSELGRSRTSHEPAHWLRNLARPGAAVAGPARAAAPGLAGDLFLGGAEGTGPALPGLPVAAKPGPGRRPSRAALAAPSLVQIGLAATADEAGEAASAMRVRAVRAPAVPLDYLWPGHPAAPAAARHERFAGPREPLTGELAASAAGFTPAALAGEPLATVGSRPGRTLEPTAAPAVLATPWPYRGVQPGAEEAEEPGWPGLDAPFAPPAMAGEPLLPPVVRGAARRA
ncbi:MAG: hypothetical protein FJ125_12835, partial [Deltaproteobacteria bacterium]|nr:hypothetical protein [Deltaproteobacteria bacterium]